MVLRLINEAKRWETFLRFVQSIYGLADTNESHVTWEF
jgi:hypothetical protein